MERINMTLLEENGENKEEIENHAKTYMIVEAESGDLSALYGEDGGIEHIMLLSVDEICKDERSLEEEKSQKNYRRVDVSPLTSEALLHTDVDETKHYYIMRPIARTNLRHYIAQQSHRQVEADTLGRRIESLCLRIGIPAHIQGFHFIHEAIRMVTVSPYLIGRITKELYPGVAARFGTTPSKVERSIRHAVTVVWTRGRVEAINEVFGFTVCTKDNKPSNGEFIALLANHCKAMR